MKEKEWVLRARLQHHDALKRLAETFGPTAKTGLQIWRALRQAEAKGAYLAVQMCNIGVSEEDQERVQNQIRARVSKALGGIPKGFFVNLDPRGYALKLEPGSVPMPLHRDWGNYQILAPIID